MYFIFADTKRYIPMKPPTGLSTIMLSSFEVVLKWNDPSLGAGQIITDSRYYRVKYIAVKGSDRHSKYFISSALNCAIGNLKPFTSYIFMVMVLKDQIESAWSLRHVITTAEAGLYRMYAFM